MDIIGIDMLVSVDLFLDITIGMESSVQYLMIVIDQGASYDPMGWNHLFSI
jgi:hypothetical protein